MPRNAQFSISVGGTREAVQDIERLDNELRKMATTSKRLRKELRDVEQAYGINSKEAQALTKQLSRTQLRTKELRDEKRGLTRQITLENREMRALDGSYAALQARTAQLTAKLRQLPGGFSSTNKQARALRREIVKNNEQLKKFDAQIGQNFRNVGNYAGSIRRVLTQVGVLFGAGAGLSGLTRGLVDLDEALADVRKTTGLTQDEVESLRVEFESFDTRTTVNGLLSIAQGLGRLGVAREEIAETTRVVDRLVVALGDDLGGTPDQIATSVGKIVSLFGEDEGGLANGLNKVGSAINFVAQNTRAQAGPIIDFTERLAGIAPQIGLTVDQVISLGTVLDANGQDVERSATSVQRLLLEMGKAPATFARFAGVTQSEFSEVLRKDVFQALQLVLKGVQTTGGGVEELARILEATGIDSQRAAGVIGVLSNNVDDLGKIAGDTNIALEEGTSLAEEFALKNETLGATASKLGKELLEAFSGRNLRDGLTELISILERVVIFIRENRTAILGAVGAFLAYRGAVLASSVATQVFVAAQGTARSVMLLTSAAVNTLRGNSIRAAAATRALGTAVSSTPWGLVASAVGLLAGVLLPKLIKGFGGAETEINAVAKATQRANEQFASQRGQLDQLIFVLRNSEKGSTEYNRALNKLNTTYGEYLPNLLTEKSRLQDIEAAQKQILNVMRQKIALSSVEDELAEAYERQREAQEALEFEQNLINAQNVQRVAEDLANIPVPQTTPELEDATFAVQQLEEEYKKLVKGLKDLDTGGDSFSPTPDPEDEKKKQDEIKKLQNEILDFYDEARKREIENIENDLDRELALRELAREQAVKSAEREAEELLENEKTTADQRKEIRDSLKDQIDNINEQAAKEALQIREVYTKREIDAKVKQLEAEAELELLAAEKRRNDRLRELGILGRAEADLTKEQARQKEQIERDYNNEVNEIRKDQLRDVRQFLEANLQQLQADLSGGIAEGILSDEDIEKLKLQVAQIEALLSGIPAKVESNIGFESEEDETFWGKIFGLDKEGAEKAQAATDAVRESLQGIADIQRARAQNEINQIEERRNAEIKAIQESAATEEEKAQRTANAEAKAQAEIDQIRKEAAKKQKAINIALAVINTAQAVIKALADPGGVAGVILSVAAGITGAAQIATIRSQQFAKGGMMEVDGGSIPTGTGIAEGRSHAQGGIKIGTNEVEGGELMHHFGKGRFAVVNKKSTEALRKGDPGIMERMFSAINTYRGYGRPLTGTSFAAHGGILSPPTFPALSLTSGQFDNTGLEQEIRELNQTLRRQPAPVVVYDPLDARQANKRSESLEFKTRW